MALPRDATDAGDGLRDGDLPGGLGGAPALGGCLGCLGAGEGAAAGSGVAERGARARGTPYGGSRGARGSLQCSAAVRDAVFILGCRPRLFVAGRAACS